MSITLSSRRTFLQAALQGGVTLPFLASLGMVTNAAADHLMTGESLCLFEADIAIGANTVADVRRLGLAYQTLTLDSATSWHAMLDMLATSSGRSLVVLGRPATVFAVRSVLEPAWRVVLEGRHNHDESGAMHHAFNGLDTPMNTLASWVNRVSSPAEYSVVLASVKHGGLAADAEHKTLDLQSPAWQGGNLVSLLIWPRGSV